VEVQEVSVDDAGTTLFFGVDTCNESSTEVTVDESDELVVVSASTRSGYGCGGRDDCQDSRSYELKEPLGDRQIVDRDGHGIRRSDG
jgi:hypothetical protein